VRTAEEEKVYLWARLDTLISGMEISETLVNVLHDVGIRYMGDLATHTEAVLIEETKVLGGLKNKEANAVMYHFDELLVAYELKWGMTPKDTYDWVPPPGRQPSALA